MIRWQHKPNNYSLNELPSCSGKRDHLNLTKLESPRSFLEAHKEKLVIIDEIHRSPEIFQSLRGLIDQGRREGLGTGRFLALGSASMDLLKQSESLAGRIAYVDMGGFSVADFQETPKIEDLWLRGGYPGSYLSLSQADSFANRRDLIRSYIEREIPMFAPRLPSNAIERLWTMLAHNQGALLNTSQLANSLGVKSPAAGRYIGLLVDLLLVRRVQPYYVNVGKRLIKSPKTYVRDSGLLHALLGIRSLDDLYGHPIAGASWEGFVIENILSAIPPYINTSFYRSVAGAEIDLIIEFGGKTGTWAIEIKRSKSPSLSRGFYSALEDIKPDRSFIVHSGTERIPKSSSVDALGLIELISEIEASTS